MDVNVTNQGYQIFERYQDISSKSKLDSTRMLYFVQAV